ncbi:hypothetical protein [Rhizobium sp. MHM7A]|uniref:hypothetical protein n=1 Tax=Rhizobium sp. MHM7A TaxID=2583233 RepID=UPI001106A957|nr:hypothetical protein [Rhizobium sp. MHM7A]TLX17206.1 hypothetical protein FFR93_07805 [Rhizobium sp. MHM7A]
MTTPIYHDLNLGLASFRGGPDFPNFKRPRNQINAAWGFEAGPVDVFLQYRFFDKSFAATVMEIEQINGKPAWAGELGQLPTGQVEALVAMLPVTEKEQLDDWSLQFDALQKIVLEQGDGLICVEENVFGDAIDWTIEDVNANERWVLSYDFSAAEFKAHLRTASNERREGDDVEVKRLKKTLNAEQLIRVEMFEAEYRSHGIVMR